MDGSMNMEAKAIKEPGDVTLNLGECQHAFSYLQEEIEQLFTILGPILGQEPSEPSSTDTEVAQARGSSPTAKELLDLRDRLKHLAYRVRTYARRVEL